MDGSVRVLKPTLSSERLCAYITPWGGEILDD